MATVEEIKAAYDANVSKTGTPPASAGDTGGAAGGTTSSITSPAYSTARTDAINQMYDSQAAARRQELRAAYDRQMSSAQAAADKIPQTYQQRANDLAVQYERNRRNLNQQAAGNGINTGTASQQALALNSAYQRDYGSIGRAQADAQAEAERNMANLTAQYESNIQSALAQNDYQKAAALLDEYNNAEQRNLKNAQILAEFGDFSGYAGIYGQEQADNMLAVWRAQNPDLALKIGNITQAQRDNLVNGKPMNDGLDANGNRIVSYGGGGGSSEGMSDYLANYLWGNNNNNNANTSGIYSPSYATYIASTSGNPSASLGSMVANGNISPGVATNIEYALKNPGR